MRTVRALIAAHGVLATLVVALVAGALLHLGSAIARRAIAGRVTRVLAGSLAGRVEIVSIGHVGLSGVDGVDARIVDPEGATVAYVYGARAHAGVLEIARAAIFGAGPLPIDLGEVSARAVDLDVTVAPDGSLGIARAFASRTPSSPGGRSVRLAIERLALDHVWVHGRPSSALAIDADLDHVAGALHVDGSRVAVDVEHFDLVTRGMPSGADAKGTGGVRVAIPSASGGALGVSGSWRGAIAGIPNELAATLDGDAITATVDAPSIPADALRALWPSSPIEGASSVRVEARGTLPRVDLAAHVASAGGSLDVTGPVVVGAAQSATLHVVARGVDVHAFSASAPVSKLDATGDLTVSRSPQGALTAKANVEVPPGRLGSERLPGATLVATFSDEARGPRADVKVTAREPGAPTLLSLHLAPKGGASALTFEVDTRVPQLDAVPRLGSIARGSSTLRAHGGVDLSRGTIDAKLEADVLDFGRNVMHLDHAAIAGEVHGPLRAPQIDASLQGEGLDIGGYRFRAVRAELHGPATNAGMALSFDADGDGTPDLGADGQLHVGNGVSIEQIHVHVAHADEGVHVTVGSVQFKGGEMVIEPVDVEGLGGPIHATWRSSYTELRVQVQGEGIDVARLGRIVRVGAGLQGCLLDVDIDIDARAARSDGHTKLEVHRCSLGRVTGVSGGIEATVHGHTLAGRAHAELDDVGAVAVTSDDLELEGRWNDLSVWKKVWGKVGFAGTLDLAKLAPRVPAGELPIDLLRGTVTVHGRVRRDAPNDDTPGVEMSLKTSGLAFDVPGASGAAPLRIEGVDVAFDARADADSGFFAADARLNDVNGELASLDLKSSAVPYGALLATPKRAVSLLEATPVNARLAFPDRDLKTLPAFMAPRGLRGGFSADVALSGSVGAPELDAHMKLSTVRAPRGISSLVDLDAAARYDGAHLLVVMSGRAAGAPVLQARLEGDVRIADLLVGSAGAWTGSVRVHLEAFPLESIPSLSDRQVSGRATADLTIDGLHKDGRASLSLDLRDLHVGDVAYRLGSIRTSIDGVVFDANAHLEQDDGSLDATAHTGASWGARARPALDPTRPVYGQLTARRFRAALLLPFVDDVFSELDGRLDSDLHVDFDPKTRMSRVQGTLGVSEGRFELAAVGGEYHDVVAKATFSPDGAVKVEGIRASAMSGVLEAAASARLRGLTFEAANATVQIPASSPLLLTVEGAQVGTVEGRLEIAAVSKNAGADLDVKVDIPTLHVGLPLTSSRDIQALGAIEGVRIGAARAGKFHEERLDSPREVVAAPSGKTLAIAVNLGSDVEVKKGATLKVALDGHPTITVSDDVRATGQVRLLSGKIDVQGKSFTIDSGTVTFEGDVTNPQCVVTASWEAPDGTMVYADFSGPLKSGKVNLRSEPALSKSEILSLILFGTADGMTGAGSGGSSSVGAGVAGGAATQPLNRALENFGLGGVSTRVDTSSSTPRADVEVQIARDISLQIAQVMGTPPPGQNPDMTLLTLNWRFVRQWSAQTTIGNAGTSILDLIWQYRY